MIVALLGIKSGSGRRADSCSYLVTRASRPTDVKHPSHLAFRVGAYSDCGIGAGTKSAPGQGATFAQKSNSLLETSREGGPGFAGGRPLPIWVSRGVREKFCQNFGNRRAQPALYAPRDATFAANEIYAIATRGIRSGDYAYFRGDEARERETRSALPAFEASEFDTLEEVK
jgi:hypothetical protein